MEDELVLPERLQKIAKQLSPARKRVLQAAYFVTKDNSWPLYGSARRPYEWCESKGLVTRKVTTRVFRERVVAQLTADGLLLAAHLFGGK